MSIIDHYEQDIIVIQNDKKMIISDIDNILYKIKDHNNNLNILKINHDENNIIIKNYELFIYDKYIKNILLKLYNFAIRYCNYIHSFNNESKILFNNYIKLYDNYEKIEISNSIFIDFLKYFNFNKSLIEEVFKPL